VDKISLSLWDVFNFLMSGALAFAALIFYLTLSGSITIKDITNILAESSAASVAIASPLGFILVGMMIEPFSNYFDKAISFAIKKSPSFLSKFKPTEFDDISKENEVLIEEVKKALPKSLSAKLDNPFHICKDYIEKKQSSNSYEIFLARFGFYRNCSFIFALLALGIASTRTDLVEQILIFIPLAAAAAIFKARSRQFFIYQAPAVFRAFLAENIISNEKSLRDDAR